MTHPSLQHIQRAVCYIRKSREDEQAERRGEDTLAKQREMLCNDVLSRYPFQYEIAEEVASGDSIRDRPVFRELLCDLGSKYQAIVVKDLSRLGRGSYADMGVVYDLIRDKRIYIITKDTVYDPANFSDLRMIRFSLFFSREEYEMTLWRLTEGKYDGAQRGRWVAGPVPYGFVYDRQTQTLKPNKDECKIVQLVFAWYTQEQLGFQAIATRLSELCIPSPRGKSKWHSEVIRRILKNPAYNGTLAFRLTQRSKLDGRVINRPASEQIVVEAAFAPLIDHDTWSMAVARRQIKIKHPAQKSTIRSELTGLVYCETCNCRLVRQSSSKTYQKRDGTTSVYKLEFLYCNTCGYAVKYRNCEWQIKKVLLNIPLPSHTLLRQKYLTLLAASKSEAGVRSPVSTIVANQLLAREENVKKRMSRAKELLLDDIFSKSEYLEVYGQCEEELTQLRNAISRLQEPISNQNDSRAHALLAQPVFESLHSMLDVYEYLSPPTLKNMLLTSIIKRIQLRREQKSGNKRKPSRFELTVWLK